MASKPNDLAPALLIKKLSPKATTPTRGSAFAAGYDLYSAHQTTVPAKGKTLVDTELAIAVPVGTCEWPLILPDHIFREVFWLQSLHPRQETTTDLHGLSKTAASPLALG